MKPKQRFKLWRIRRKFVTVRKLFDSIPLDADYRKDAAELEVRFVSESLKRMREGFIAHNVSKQARKAFFDKIVKGDV